MDPYLNGGHSTCWPPVSANSDAVERALRSASGLSGWPCGRRVTSAAPGRSRSAFRGLAPESFLSGCADQVGRARSPPLVRVLVLPGASHALHVEAPETVAAV